VGRDTPRGILVPILSIGYHLVLQTSTSLTKLLRDAGFVDVDVRQVDGGQLRARCRREPGVHGPAVALADPGSREQYRRYLRDAAEMAKSDSDLWFGLIARAYREAINEADCGAANLLWYAFSKACHRRFGFDPEAGAEADIDATEVSLESLALHEPLCLGPMLLHRAFHRLHIGDGRRAVEALLGRAADACGRLRGALQQIGSDDGDAEDVGWVAGAEELLCASERGATNVPERFDSLGPAPADTLAGRQGKPLLTEHYRRRIFVSLINAARLDEADRLAYVVTAVEAHARVPGGLLADDELDVLFCAALRELQRPEGGAERALGLLRQLRVACSAACLSGRSGSPARLASLSHSREVLALEVLGRIQEAEALRQAEQAANAGEVSGYNQCRS
jgi:hypothetical protein